MLALGYYRGLRLGEIRNVRWDNVDLRAGVICLAPGETKSGKGRVIPLNPTLTNMLKKLRHETNSTYLFGNGRPLGSFRKTWYSTCVKCCFGNYEGLGEGSRAYIGTLFHDLCRSAIRNMMQGGIDPNEARAISGHETASVFKRYNIITEDRLVAAGEKADAYIAAERKVLTSDTIVHAEIVRPALPEAKNE